MRTSTAVRTGNIIVTAILAFSTGVLSQGPPNPPPGPPGPPPGPPGPPKKATLSVEVENNGDFGIGYRMGTATLGAVLTVTGNGQVSWSVSPTPQSAVEVDPSSGKAKPGQPGTVTMRLDRSRLRLGEYTETLEFIYDVAGPGGPKKTSVDVEILIARKLAVRIWDLNDGAWWRINNRSDHLFKDSRLPASFAPVEPLIADENKSLAECRTMSPGGTPGGAFVSPIRADELQLTGNTVLIGVYNDSVKLNDNAGGVFDGWGFTADLYHPQEGSDGKTQVRGSCAHDAQGTIHNSDFCDNGNCERPDSKPRCMSSISGRVPKNGCEVFQVADIIFNINPSTGLPTITAVALRPHTPHSPGKTFFRGPCYTLPCNKGAPPHP